MSSRRYDLPRIPGDTLSNGSRSFRNAEEDTLKYDRMHSASWTEGILFTSSQQERTIGLPVVSSDAKLTRLRELENRLKIVNTRHMAGLYAKEMLRFIHHIINLNQTIKSKFAESDYEAVNIQVAFLMDVWKDVNDFENNFNTSWTTFRKADVLPNSFRSLHALLHKAWEDLLNEIHLNIKNTVNSKQFVALVEKVEKISIFCCLCRNFELIAETTRNCDLCPLCRTQPTAFSKVPNPLCILRFAQLVGETRAELICGKSQFKDIAIKIRGIALDELKFSSDCFVFRLPHLEESTQAAYVPFRSIGSQSESTILAAMSLSLAQPISQEIISFYVQYFFACIFNKLSNGVPLVDVLEAPGFYISMMNDVVVPGTIADNNLIIQNVQLPVNKLRHTKRFPKMVRLNPHSIIRILTSSRMIRAVFIGDESQRLCNYQSYILKKMNTGENFEMPQESLEQLSEGAGNSIVFPNRIITTICRKAYQIMKGYLISPLLSTNTEIFCPSYTVFMSSVVNWIWRMCLRYPKGGAMHSACVIHSDALSLADAFENMLTTYMRNVGQVQSIQGLDSSNTKDIRQIVLNIATFHRVPIHYATRTSLTCGRFSLMDDFDTNNFIMETVRCLRLSVGYLQEKIGTEVVKNLQTLFVLTKKTYQSDRGLLICCSPSTTSTVAPSNSGGGPELSLSISLSSLNQQFLSPAKVTIKHLNPYSTKAILELFYSNILHHMEEFLMTRKKTFDTFSSMLLQQDVDYIRSWANDCWSEAQLLLAEDHPTPFAMKRMETIMDVLCGRMTENGSRNGGQDKAAWKALRKRWADQVGFS